MRLGYPFILQGRFITILNRKEVLFLPDKLKIGTETQSVYMVATIHGPSTYLKAIN